MDTRILSEHLDGPALVAWIEGWRDIGENIDLRLGHHAKRIREWRRGGVAEHDCAERVLEKLDLHIGMVPDELYVPDPRALQSAA